MLPGPTNILRCSQCSGLIEQETIISGNTIGASYWTDGKVEAPMLPDQPDLVKCPHCYAVIWIDDLEQVDECIGSPQAYPEFKQARPFKNLTFKDYILYLKNGSYPRRHERYIRLMAWWKGNDKRRKAKTDLKKMTKDENVNLNCLMALFDEEDASDLLLKAEAYRELGNFKAAKELLLKCDPTYFPEACDGIWQLSVEGDKFVREIMTFTT